jgi:hypothetical protein
MMNAIFLDVTPCGTCKKRRFGGTHLLHSRGGKNRRSRNKFSSNWHSKNAAKK